jgi:hypothetical protein
MKAAKGGSQKSFVLPNKDFTGRTRHFYFWHYTIVDFVIYVGGQLC